MKYRYQFEYLQAFCLHRQFNSMGGSLFKKEHYLRYKYNRYCGHLDLILTSKCSIRNLMAQMNSIESFEHPECRIYASEMVFGKNTLNQKRRYLRAGANCNQNHENTVGARPFCFVKDQKIKNRKCEHQRENAVSKQIYVLADSESPFSHLVFVGIR